MRIAWVTAYGQRSGIAIFSAHIARALAGHADVDIWTNDEPPLLDAAGLPVVRFGANPDVERRLADYDVVAYNIGNTPQPHAAINELSKRHPGIVILHDRVLHPMFVAKWRGAGGFIDPAYLSSMAAHYGQDGLRAARESIAGNRPPIWEDDEAMRFPLTEEALQRALGAVTHSEGHASYVRSHWFGPVRALAHPAYADDLELAPKAPPRMGGDRRVQLTTIGHITPNKQVHRIVRLLADDADLAARTHYTIVGPLDRTHSYPGELEELLCTVPHVSAELLGWRDEDELHRLMAATDVFINLRHPVMEGASGSLMLELSFGRPVLCFDGGAFGELPDGTVARVPLGDYEAAAGALRRLVDDPAYRHALGQRGRALAESRTEEAYARDFLAFTGEVRAAAPKLALIDRIATELGAMRADPGLAIFDTVAGELERLLPS